MRKLLFIAVFIALLPLAWASSVSAATCKEADQDSAIAQVGQLTTLLKIANFRADVTYMGQIATELEQYLSTCGDEVTGKLAQVCDFDCHLQLGRYRLFLAAQLPFLSSASGISRNDSPLSPQSAQAIGEQGIEVVDRGLRILARQQGRSNGNAEAENSSYRKFVGQMVTLSSLKIQLLMNTGDVWYQTVSEARIKQLDFMISDTLDAVSGSALKDQPNLFKANTNYEAALWALVEIKMDIPGESTYDDLRADLLLIESDLQSRVGSLRKGYLFLNIDPMQFTTISFEELQQQLQRTQSNLDAVEAKVEVIVERWQANKLGETTRALDEERTIRSQQVNLVTHQIGKLEQESRVFANAVQQDLNAVDAQLDSFAYRQQIRGLELELTRKIGEFDNQRKQLQQRRELDLLVLSKEAETERRNELRWLLNWEMTKMNLDLQISSLESQITEYDRQTLRNVNQLEQLAKQRQVIQTQIANANSGIAQAQATIVQINLRRTDIFAKRRLVEREDICGVESQLAFVGAPIGQPFAPLAGEQPCQIAAPAFTRQQYFSQMCGVNGQPGLRKKLLNSQVQAKAFLMKCVIGNADFSDVEPMIADQQMVKSDIPLPQELANVNCGSFTQTETEFAKKMYDAEKAMYEKRRSDIQEARNQVDSQLSEVIGFFAAFNGTTQAAQIILTSVQATYAVAAAVPETTICACAMASGVATKIDLAKPIRGALDAAQSILSTIIATGRITQENINQINGLKQRLTQLRQAGEQLDLEKQMKSRALIDTHFQLAGRQAQGAEDIKELTLHTSIAAVDCDNQALGIDEQISRLNAEHARMVASMNLNASENDLLSFQTADQQRNIDRSQNEIAILGLELDKLTLTEDQLKEDNKRVAELVDATKGRIARVQSTQTTVTGLSDESNASTNIINEIRERQKQKMLALSDGELAFVEQRIMNEKGNTEQLVAGLQEASDTKVKSRDLQAKIIKFQGEVMDQVSKEQEKLTNLVSKVDDTNTRKNLFIANQESLAELLKGIPEYLVTKRRELETANLLLSLMNRRFEVVRAITGQEGSTPQVYVRNATQLAGLVSDISNKRFFDERQINIDVAQIVIPSNSGFARKLALTEKVDFEVSPFAATEALMKENGFFAVWSTSKFRERRNLTLVDAFVGTQYQCTGAQWNRFALEHRGSGFVFRPLTKGSSEVSSDVVVGPQRSKLQTFFNLADSQDEVNRIIRYWVQDLFQVRKFPRPNGPSNDTTSALPYLGAPLIGSYRISLQPSDCPFDGAVFTLYFIFASEP